MTFPPMSSYEERRSTFFDNEDAATGKGRKKPQAAWPHPVNASSSASTSSARAKTHPSPSEMATLGLYFDVTLGDTNVDTCRLYPEGHTLEDWKAGDSVRERILAADPTASLVLIHDSDSAGVEGETGQEWTWTAEALLPTSKAMNEARLRTFGSAWPYDGKKGWKPTSKKVAQAGFHFTPNETEDDCATCVYCDCALGGWEKTDDPVQEHKRRRPECKFFNCAYTAPPPPEEKVAAPTKKTRSTSTAATKRTRAVSKRKNKNDEESEAEEDEEVPAMAKSDEAEKKQETLPKSRSVSRAKKQAKLTDDESSGQPTVKKTASTSRKASQRAPKAADITVASKTVIDLADEDEEMQELEEPEEEQAVQEVVEKAESKPEEAVAMTAKGESAARKSDQSQVQQVEQPVAIALSGQSATSEKQARKSQAVPVAAASSAPPASEPLSVPTTTPSVVKRPSKLSPYIVAPLTELANLDAAEQDMSVESWLKLQVAKACQEMEREGKQRIERLHEEIGKGRIEIEAALRGRTSTTQTAA